jgi:autotransporter-associated beta strand protein
VKSFNLLLAAVFLLVSHLAYGGSATWNQNPTSGDWNTAANWTPNTVPNGVSDIATFSTSSIYNVDFPPSSNTTLDSLIFEPGGTQFLISVAPHAHLTFVGGGLVDRSTTFPQLYVAFGGSVAFQNNARSNGFLEMTGAAFFSDQARMSGFLNCYGELSGVNHGGVVIFADRSTVTGVVNVFEGVNGGAAGTVYFNDDCTADPSFLFVRGHAVVDISGHNAPGLAVSVLDGVGGRIYLGSNNLSVKNEYVVSARPTSIQLLDGGNGGGSGGTLTKIGNASSLLTLSGNNSYSGGTFVEGGTLFIDANMSRNPVGSGDVHIDNGTFGGAGRVNGNVFVGAGTGAAARLMVGGGTLEGGLLTIAQGLSFASDGTYETGINTKSAHANQVQANGITIAAGAQISVIANGENELTLGTVFTIVDNTAATATSGTFNNLPDGGTIIVGNNTFQANYEGGDGNDLTLTVVP